MNATYTLFHAGERLGTIKEENADFPSFFGAFEMDPGVRGRAELEEVLAYIDWSVRTAPLVEAERFEEIAEEEAQFTTLIESEEWVLEAADGEVVPILVPLFGTAGGVVWRLNVRRRQGVEKDPAET